MIKKIVIVIIFAWISKGLLASPVTLQVNEQTQLKFWPCERNATGGLLLIQGHKGHGDRLLTKIAETLSKRGWSVAVVPTYFPDEQFSEQLSASLAKLRQQTKLKIAVVWYGDGYHQLLDYFSKPQAKKVSGLILLSASQLDGDKVDKPWKLRFPILDIIGQFDYHEIVKSSVARKSKFNKNTYFKRVIPGASHDYRYQEEYLGAAIDNWLTKIPSPRVGRRKK